MRRRDFLRAAASLAFLSSCKKTAASEYDLCIVGTGFAGVFSALEMVGSTASVVMLEAGGIGGSAQDQGVDSRLASFTASNAGSLSYDVRGTRMLKGGGASGHWGGVTTRMWPEDFRLRSEYGMDVDWPISYEELDQYYCLAEQALSVRGYSSIAGLEPSRACEYPRHPGGDYRSPDMPIDGAEYRFFGVARSAEANGPTRLADRFLPRLQDTSNFTVLYQHPATKIVSLDGKRVDHVEVRDAAGDKREIRASVYVLAAGTVETTRLLLSSTSSHFPDGLGNRHDILGRFFSVHPSWEWRIDVAAKSRLPIGEHRSCSMIQPYRESGLGGAHLNVKSDARSEIWRFQPEMESRPDNRITVDGSRRDVFGSPLPVVHLSYSERDKATISKGGGIKRQLTESVGFAVGPHWFRWRAHPAGGIPMGTDSANSMVDAYGKLHEIDNLYVSGAATFPVQGTSNPTATVVALALRLSAHLRWRLQG